ncbi:MAG: hypothetical protein HKN03_11155 [Acidimicrobiales bacterium]|nr:hypothetical protein [Acidimicrobiales bacterium]
MVIYRGADGKPGYHQTDDIHDAVMYVEGLRNDKEVDHARIFRLEEVTFEYKPYYRVELSVGGAAVTSGGNGSSGSETLAAADSNDDDDVMETTESAAHDSDDSDDVDDSDAVDAEDSTDAEDSADTDDVGDGDDHDEDAVPSSGVRRGLFGR